MTTIEDYDLARDHMASVRCGKNDPTGDKAMTTDCSRLNAQHSLWKETLGFMIPTHSDLQGPDVKIADVGTGTGIWLLDIAKQLHPSAELNGFDISTAGFPPQEWLPKTVTLNKLDIFHDPPDPLHNKYDLVHIRLFLRVLQDRSPEDVLEHCLKMLSKPLVHFKYSGGLPWITARTEPGGILQWEEYDHEATSTETSSALVPHTATDKLREIMQSHASEWVSPLPKTFEQHGLISVSTIRKNEDRSLSRYMMDLELALADEFALTAFDSKGLSEQGTALRHLVRDVYEEVQQGAAIRHTFQVVMGQKPNTRDRDQGVKEEKPTILFVPGAFHTEAHFQPLSDILEKSSFPTVTASPPTQTHPGVEMNYKEDIKSVRLLLETLVNKEGREVILVPHSYGGVIASQAVKGLERSQIRAEGRPGGIIQVFFINALFVAKGQFLDEALDAGKLPDWAVFKDGLLVPGETKSVFFNDLPPAEVDHWNSLLVPKSPSRACGDVADLCYDLDINITALLGADDVMLTELEGMVARTKRPSWRVIKTPGGHCLFLSRPVELAALIETSVNSP